MESRRSGIGDSDFRSALGDLSGNGEELDGACGSGASSWFTRDSWIRFMRFPMRALFASSDWDVFLTGVESAKTSSICSRITVCLVFILFALEVGHSTTQLVHRRNPLTVPAFSPTARGEAVLTKSTKFGARTGPCPSLAELVAYRCHKSAAGSKFGVCRVNLAFCEALRTDDGGGDELWTLLVCDDVLRLSAVLGDRAERHCI